MFYDCLGLEELNLSSFNINNIKDIGSMFSFCISLKKLSIINFNNNIKKKINNMFHCCPDKLIEEIKAQN